MAHCHLPNESYRLNIPKCSDFLFSDYGYSNGKVCANIPKSERNSSSETFLILISGKGHSTSTYNCLYMDMDTFIYAI